MALTSSFGYTNTTAISGLTVPVTDVKPDTNYAKVADEPTEASYKNRTSPLNQEEKVTYRCQNQKVNQQVAYPGPSKDGVFYVIKVDDVLRTTDSSDPTFAVDEPISMWLSVKHTTSNNWTNAQILSILERILGLCYDKTNSKWRFEDFMRSALTPEND